MRVCPVSRVHVHRHRIQLLETRHGLEQQHDDSATLDRLDRPGEQVGRDGFVILQDEHTECLTEDLGAVFVVCISNIGDGDKELKGVLLVGFADTAFDIPLDLGLSFLAMSVASVMVWQLDKLQKIDDTYVVKPRSFL